MLKNARVPSSESHIRTSGPWDASTVPLQRVDPWAAEQLRRISDNHTVILLLLHALNDLFTGTQLQTGLARCLTNFRLSLHYKIVIHFIVPEDLLLGTHSSGSLFSETLFSHLDSASLHPDSILCWQYTRGWRLHVRCSEKCKN